MTEFFLACFGVNTLNGGDIRRCGHVIDDCVEKLLYTLVLIGSTADYGNDLVVDSSLSECFLKLGYGNFFAFAELFEKFFIGFGYCLNHGVMVFLSLIQHICRDRLNSHILTEIIVVDIGFHVHQVDDSAECVFGTDRELNRNSIGFETFPHLFNYAIEVCAHDIHFVDVSHSRNTVLIGLSPNCFGLRFNAALSTENGYRSVEDSERTLDFNCKVNVTGSVDYIDSRIFPEAGCSCGGNCNTSFLFLFHEVHNGCTLMSLADFMSFSGVEQYALRCSCLTGIDVSHDTDISGTLK